MTAAAKTNAERERERIVRLGKTLCISALAANCRRRAKFCMSTTAETNAAALPATI